MVRRALLPVAALLIQEAAECVGQVPPGLSR